jgi:hypothetical protein
MLPLIGIPRGCPMKIHIRPALLPLPSAPRPKPLQTTMQMELQAEELTSAARQQRATLKKLYRRGNQAEISDEEVESGEDGQNLHPKRSIDFIV